jgi:ActR/RegA family two-component response regulator
MFKEYLLIYSSEKFVKAGIKHYLRNPSKSISVMSDLFIDTYGIKKKTTLSPEELDEAIDIYWEKFKVFGRLK